MSIEALILGTLALLVGAAGLAIFLKLKPKKLKPDYYVDHWKQVQGFCRDKADWPKALEAADKLLDHALKRRRFKGGSMGERLVSAQRKFTNNNAVWFAHNLYKKITSAPQTRLKEDDVKYALIGFRQALRDLGAFEQPEASEETKS